MKLWIDDLREPPNGFEWATTSREAIDFINEHGGDIEEISFDHDLGGDDTTRRVMTWMVEYNVWPNHVHVHTANPVGREWLYGTAERYKPSTTTLSR